MYKLINPYKNLNWNNQYKTQLHAHTYPHGSAKAEDLIDLHIANGYDVLALTDHDGDDDGTGEVTGATGDERTTYPWTDLVNFPYADENRNSDELNITAIEGNELSNHSHLISLFNDAGFIPDEVKNEKEQIEIIKNKNGLGLIAHPDRRSYQTYIDWFEDNPHFIGLEIVNMDGRYRSLIAEREFNKFLTTSMPEKLVWGFCVSDVHSVEPIKSRLDVSWIELIIDNDLTKESIRNAIIKGNFYGRTRSIEPNSLTSTGEVPALQDETLEPPEITNITFDNEKIQITANNYNKIEWIGRFEGRTLTTGTTFSYQNKSPEEIGCYVRARLHGDGGRAFINPIGLRWFNWCESFNFIN